MSTKRKPVVAIGLLAKPGAAPTRSAPIEDLPRASERSDTPPLPVGTAGLKASTIGTTLYLLPDESKRLKRLALDLDISLHELMLTGLDRLLSEHGQPPVRRYLPALPRKEKTR
jgi:hypothetical protein